VSTSERLIVKIAALPLQLSALPDDWPKWINRFEQYHIASGIAEESDTNKISTLLYCWLRG